MKRSMYIIGIIVCFMVVITTNLVYAADDQTPKTASKICEEVAAEKGAQAGLDSPSVPAQTKKTLLMHWFNECMDEQKKGEGK